MAHLKTIYRSTENAEFQGWSARPDAAAACGLSAASDPAVCVAYRCQNDAQRSLLAIGDDVVHLSGYRAAELLAGPIGWTSLIHADDRAQVRRTLQDTAAAGRAFAMAYRLVRRDGGTQPVREQGQGVRDAAGRLLGYSGFIAGADAAAPEHGPFTLDGARALPDTLPSAKASDESGAQSTDAAEPRRGEPTPHADRQRLQRLADAMPQLVWTARPDGTVDYYNDRVTEYAGIHQTADGSWRWQPVLHEDDRERTVEAYRQALASGDTYECEHRVRMADGQLRWHLTRAVPMRDAAGNIVEWFGTATDIHDIKRAQQALEAADRRKTRFVATMAHELRNPLAPIRHAVDLLMQTDDLAPTAASARDIIDRQSRHLARLVDDLLDMSRITNDRLRLQCERVLLSALVDQAYEAVAEQVAGREQSITVELPAQPVRLNADAARLVQVLVNLLDNASKYSPEGARIELSAERDGDEAVVRVSDSGIGIDAADLPRLFEMFAQVGEDTGADSGGLGIGLALTRRLVELHGGTIGATSDGAGKGSTLTVRLPALAEEKTSGEPAAAAPGARASGAAVGTAADAAGKGGILIADDNDDVVQSLAMLLELRGYDVDIAHDGLQALAAVERERPDTVILDIGMPGLDGHAACRRIRQLPGGERLRIIALTGWGEARDRRNSAEAGFDAHLVKPIESAVLLGLLADTRN